MLLHRFPFDQQVLNIILEPAFCMSDEVQLVLNKGGDIDWDQVPRDTQTFKRTSDVNDFIDNSLQLSEWNLVRVKGDESTIDISACRAVFDKLDINQDGIVHANELIESVKNGVEIPKGLNETWDELFARIDLDMNGSLEWDEFKKAVTSDIRVVAIEKVNHYLSDDTRWSRITLRMAVIRQWKYYGVKICSILILISLLAIPMFRLGQHELEARINLVLTLFLSATAFQFVVGESLPKVGYTTYMDAYLMVHNLLLLVLAAEALLVHYINPSENTTVTAVLSNETSSLMWTPDQVDDACMYSYLVMLAVVNGVFFGVGTRLYNSPEMREAGLTSLD
jgi:hypothetical protein